MAKAIALLCHSRTSCLVKALNSLALAEQLDDYDLYVFIDGPRTFAEGGLVQAVRSLVEDFSPFIKSRSVSIFQSEVNIGTWQSKLSALAKCFSSGAEVVLLLEDDVVIAQDALIFIDDASIYANERPDIFFTISLYSHHLNKGDKLTYSNAFRFAALEPEIESQWACRQWPFPWGVALVRKAYEALILNSWNGNDQNMGVILKALNGYDIYPIFTRAEHIGVYSSTNQKEIIIGQHCIPPFKAVSSFNFNKDFGPNEACKVAARFQVELANDQGINDNVIKLYYKTRRDYDLAASEYSKYYHIIGHKIEDSVAWDDDARLKLITSKTECANVVICMDDQRLARALANYVKAICKIRIIDSSMCSSIEDRQKI